MTLLKTRVETFKIDKVCDRCRKGLMIATGNGYTQLKTMWEHKCNNENCRLVNFFEDTYPQRQYVEVGKPKKIKEK